MVYTEPIRHMNDPNQGFFGDLKARILHLFGWKLLIDFILKPDYKAPIKTGNPEQFTVREAWTRRPLSEISEMGYCHCYGWKDNLAWWGCPTYIKITGGIVPDAINKETATTHNDRMKSNATKKFVRSLWRTSLPSLSIQQIALIGILGIGAVVGMWWMGVF